MRVSAVFRLTVSALCGLALVGCVASPQAPRVSPTAPARPAAVVVPQTAPSAASQAVRQHFARVQADLLSNGLLRTDGGGRDTPFTDRMLAENFIRIALYDEYVRGSGGPVQRETPSRLRRWEAPVRVGLRFGASVSPSARATDTARVRSYLARLNRLTGHPIALNDAAPNFFIYIVNEDERRALGPTAAAALPGLSGAEVAGITDMPLSTYCLVYAMSEGNSGRYTRAFAVIRAEHPDLLRLSCMHEEIAQAMGLANDSPRARPSIFNDDEEFALLTGQDELMLRMLYNPALRTGMAEAEARPIVESLARALLGGES
ncbi:DUF2927 domain-containing protein [Pseudotabrizicola formosa]|uniref:DUF2927 domain-containing protein n=1 Tax=Pseudotabrizicola formosa TaxID=2030009 RepID=UPI000CD2F15C|nr:DUF2927 domain-containing protein [Pseudotabrizicola formosa]